MKTLLLFIVFLSIIGSSIAQTTLILQPGPDEGKDAKVFSLSPSNNYGNDQDFIAAAWTWDGTPGLLRSYLQFDLSSIPEEAGIISAKLSLFYNDESTSNGQEGENAAYLRRVIEDWDESTIDWTSKPDATSENQIYLNESTSISQDYLDIDVKTLVQDMIENPEESFGFLMILDVEETYASMKFCTSDFDEEDQRPMLEIVYSLNNNPGDTTSTQDTTEVEVPIIDTVGYDCLNIQPGTSILGVDAKIWDLDPTNNFGSDPDFIGASWTWIGEVGTLRSLIKFDLTEIPEGAIIESAYISLFYNHESTSNGQEGENAAYLRRITSPWEEDIVTWNTQPSTTSSGEITLPLSTSIDEDYIDIDVTDMVTEMASDPAMNYGFLMRQVVESVYSSMKFYSSDADVTEDQKPKLLVCYTLDTTLYNGSIEAPTNIQLYPNPFNNYFIIKGVDFNTINTISISDVTGRIVVQQDQIKYNSNSSDVIIYDVENLSSGIYIVQIVFNDNSLMRFKAIK